MKWLLITCILCISCGSESQPERNTMESKEYFYDFVFEPGTNAGFFTMTIQADEISMNAVF